MKVLIGNPAFKRPLGNGLERYLLGSGMRFPLSLLKRADERPRYSMFPFFLAYAAGLYEREGFDVHVLDGVPLNLSEDEFAALTVKAGPAVILLEPTTTSIDSVLQFSERLKQETGARILLAGSHATVNALDILREHPHIDYVALGEYEHIGLHVLRAIRDGNSVQGIKGLASRNAEGMPMKTERAPLIEPLDDLPPPARHLFPANFENDLSLYHDGLFQLSPATYMHSSRGCPYRCDFCVWPQVLYRNKGQRYFSPARIVDEMEMLKKRFGIREVYFDDDNFTSNKKHVKNLCAEIRRRGIPVRWSAMGDAIALNDAMLEDMARSGCIGLKIGLDSADQEILKKAGKPLNVSRLDGLVTKASSLGIKTHMTVVFGMTGESKETIQHTFDFACDLDIDSVQFSIATPCPGTDMYEQLVREERITAQNWEEFDGANMSVIRYDAFSNEFLESFTADAHTRWLRAKMRKPRWLARQVRYLFRLSLSQGLGGLARRLKRGLRLLKGDSKPVNQVGVARSLRY